MVKTCHECIELLKLPLKIQIRSIFPSRPLYLSAHTVEHSAGLTQLPQLLQTLCREEKLQNRGKHKYKNDVTHGKRELGQTIPGCMARDHISSTEPGVFSSGAWSTITVDPTIQRTQPNTPIIRSLSFNMKWARIALPTPTNNNRVAWAP